MEITYANGSITPEEVARFLALTDRATEALVELARMKEIRGKAAELGLAAAAKELQRAVDDFRAARGLHSAEATRRFLEAAGLTQDDLEAYCEALVLADALKSRWADQKRVEEYFINHRGEFDRARLSRIVTDCDGLAREIVLRVREDGEDFHQLARAHSTCEDTRYAGGYVGLVARAELPPDVAAKVFHAEAGQVVGPFAGRGRFEVYLVEEVVRAELTDALRCTIRERIFAEHVGKLPVGSFAVEA